jgi:hypothetical protein
MWLTTYCPQTRSPLVININDAAAFNVFGLPIIPDGEWMGGRSLSGTPSGTSARLVMQRRERRTTQTSSQITFVRFVDRISAASKSAGSGSIDAESSRTFSQ